MPTSSATAIPALTRRQRFVLGASLLLCSSVWAGSEPVVTQTSGKADTKPSPDVPAKPSLVRGEDGKIDLSNFIDQAYGFMPLAVPITEPAVGAGLVGALAFIDRKPETDSAGFGRPNLSVIGALGTENGTEGYFGADSRYWLDDQIQTIVAGIKSSVNLDYYGNGQQGFLNHNPQSYNLDVTGATAQVRYRLGDTPNWLGMSYLMATSSVSFNNNLVLPLADRELHISGVGFSFNHDTRDNIFTPLKGNYFEAAATIFSDALGSDLDFKRYSLVGMQYLPLERRTSLGLRESFTANSGDTPFYMQPYVYMRGVPAMRYQGEKVAQIEAEVFWRGWDRVSLIGFIGAGAAANSISNMSGNSTVVAGGAGVRYEIARKYGLHMGLDAAWSRDGPAIYVQFGSAWARP